MKEMIVDPTRMAMGHVLVPDSHRQGTITWQETHVPIAAHMDGRANAKEKGTVIGNAPLFKQIDIFNFVFIFRYSGDRDHKRERFDSYNRSNYSRDGNRDSRDRSSSHRRP